MTMRDALNAAMREEMRRDPSVFLLGEEVGDVFDVARTHNPGVINRNVGKKSVEIHVLLGMGIDQIMEMMSGDR